MTASRCERCGRPTELYLCSQCARYLVRTLESVPWLVEQLTISAYGGRALNRLGDPTPRYRGPIPEHLAESPVPWKERAVRALDDLHTALARGVAALADDTDTAGAVEELAASLGCRVADLARTDTAADLVEEIGRAVEAGVEAINRTREGVFLGPCPTPLDEEPDGRPIRCAQPLYARRSASGAPAPSVSCWRCRTEHDTDELRQRAWETAEAMLFSGAEILRVMRELGEPIPRSRFYAWRRSGEIQPRGWLLGDGRIVQYETAGARPVFSLAEVRALAATPDREAATP